MYVLDRSATLSIEFCRKSGYGTIWLQKAISWGKMQVTQAICIIFGLIFGLL